MSCNLLEFEGFKPNFGILSSCTHVRVATITFPHVVKHCRFQAARMYELQPTSAAISLSNGLLSSRTYVRVATWSLDWTWTGWGIFQAARMYELQPIRFTFQSKNSGLSSRTYVRVATISWRWVNSWTRVLSSRTYVRVATVLSFVVLLLSSAFKPHVCTSCNGKI